MNEFQVPNPRGRSAIYIAGIAFVLVAGGLFVILRSSRNAHEDAERQSRADAAAGGPTVAFVLAKAGPATRQLIAPGDVRPYRQVTVYAKVSGYLADLRVDRGAHVTSGEVLGVVTSPETDLQIAPLEANFNTKEGIANRLRPMVTAGVATPQDLDRAMADVTSARAEIERLRALRGYNEIRAPFAGVVTTRYVDAGALMSAATGSTQTAQPLVDIADTSRVRVIVYLGQREAPLVKEGDAVSLVRDLDPTHPTAATITRLPRELDPRTRTMPVEIEVPNDDGLFYPGAYVQVTMTVKAPPGVLIPADAVFMRDNKPMVALIKNGHAVYTPVDIADDDGKIARVLTGVASGDHVGIHVSDEVADGQAVRAVEPPKPPPPPGSGSGAGSGAGSAAGSAASSGSAASAGSGSSTGSASGAAAPPAAPKVVAPPAPAPAAKKPMPQPKAPAGRR